VRKIGKAIEQLIEQRRSIPFTAPVRATPVRAAGKRNPARFRPAGRPNKPAKKCNSRLKSQRGNLHRSARCVNRFPFNFDRKSRDADKAVQRSGGGK